MLQDTQGEVQTKLPYYRSKHAQQLVSKDFRQLESTADMKFKGLLFIALLAVTSLSACSSDERQPAPATNTIPTESQLRDERARGQARLLLGAYRDGYAKAMDERGQSIYSSGLTPAQVLNCMMQRFDQALAVMDESVDFLDVDQFETQVPDETQRAWLLACIN